MFSLTRTLTAIDGISTGSEYNHTPSALLAIPTGWLVGRRCNGIAISTGLNSGAASSLLTPPNLASSWVESTERRL
ncbi:MAG: hypothetical protein GY782_09210 [Gammaproteobacteria bacterium]|nr:hypothetical protein [Gammaproteobacteria bacterium]